MNEDEWLGLSRGEFLSAWYRNEYAHNAYSGATGKVQRAMHSSLERGYTAHTRFNRVLEVGGNRGEHLAFVKHQFDEYVLTDIADQLSDDEKDHLSERSVRFEVVNVEKMPFEDASFARVVNTCVLHHLTDPEVALFEIRRVLEPQGTADIFLSSDPGLAFRLARTLGPVRTAQKSGLGEVKRLVDARDHINHVGGLIRLVKHVFRDDLVIERAYPIPLVGWNMSLWHTFRIKKNDG